MVISRENIYRYQTGYSDLDLHCPLKVIDSPVTILSSANSQPTGTSVHLLFVFVWCLTLSHTTLTLNELKQKPFENIVRKGGNAGNRYFLL